MSMLIQSTVASAAMTDVGQITYHVYSQQAQATAPRQIVSKREGNSLDPWDRVRMIESYPDMNGFFANVRVFKNSAKGALISNITDFVPCVLFMPTGSRPVVSKEELNKVLCLQLRDTSGVVGGLEFMRRYMISCIGAIDGRYYSQPDWTFYIQFLFCTAYFRESRLTTNTLCTGPDILWGCVVPRETSLEFHYDFLNMNVIEPENYGLEFWYNMEGIKSPELKLLFKQQMREQLPKLHLRGVGKSAEEMASLMIPYEGIVPKTGTVEEKKQLGISAIRRAITELVPPPPVPMASSSGMYVGGFDPFVEPTFQAQAEAEADSPEGDEGYYDEVES